MSHCARRALGPAEKYRLFPQSAVITFPDYLEAGERAFDATLKSRAGLFNGSRFEGAAKAEQAIVRVRISYDLDEKTGTVSTSFATGTLIQSGRYVLSVAHAMERAREHQDSIIGIVLCDGRSFQGKRPSLDHYDPRDTRTDWCLIEIDQPPSSLPSLIVGESTQGEQLVMGFPGRHGRSADGTVALDDSTVVQPLRPLHILCRSLDDKTLELLAGCVPLGGISGAPCTDEHGTLVAIERGYTESQHDNRTVVTLDVVPTDGVLSALRALDSK